ncbi:MAG: hypothetical protein DRG59_09385 [Deltaproteobacteria bacterium]|nr:MAG: hypothetical protein DRG59_09385 [Deltaproteobacteria bacterium]
MKFLRGNPEHLQGRAVIFLELKETRPILEEHEGIGLLAVFCAATEMDLLELIIQVMHLPREHSRLITRFYKRYFQEIEEIKRSFPLRISKIIDEIIEEEQEKLSEPTLESFREMFRRSSTEDEACQEAKAEKGGKLPQPEFYSTMIPLPSREFVEPFAETDTELEFDVIDLETSEHIEVGQLMLDAHARLYVADYMNQKEKQIDLPGQKTYKSPYKNYKQLSKEEFKRLLAELSSELMFLHQTGGDSDRVFADLKQLTSGSYLMREVVSMYNISTTQDPNKIKLMELYFRKIFALIDEDYLLAKEIDEEIQKYSV